MKKIALSLLLIFFAHSCAAQFIDLRSALSFFSENKLVSALCALGIGAMCMGKVVDGNKKIDQKNQIDSYQSQIDIFQNRNVSKISIYLANVRSNRINSLDDSDKIKKECDEEAKRIANLIGSEHYPFTPSKTDVPHNYPNKFYYLRFVPGSITCEKKNIGCTKIEQKERFCCWVPKIAYTVGGLSLFTAGVIGAARIAANKK